MKKKILAIALLVVASLSLFACKEEVTPLTAITFSGADDVTVDFDAPFNVLDGVKAVGNNGVDYSDQITYSHVATTVITDDVLDTKLAGEHMIKYEVEVDGILSQKFRKITVKQPAAVEGEMFVNPDFTLGTAGWVSNDAYLIGEGGELTLTTEEVDGNPALKAEVVAGWAAVRPRFGQLDIPFEQGKTYKVSYDAKSSVEKMIDVQLGELLTAAPWITDFIPYIVNHTITTEWDTYEFVFTMELDNQKGGLLFGLGLVGGVSINATMWFDNFEITEVSPESDETAPRLTGVSASRSILVDAEFNALSGVKALDLVDGDISSEVTYVITDEDSNVVDELDTSLPGKYTITYSAEDSAGNIATKEMVLEIVGMQFNDENLVANPSFDAALTEEKPEWSVWAQDWGTAPVVESAIDIENGLYTVDITGGGDASWAVQLTQDGYITLEEGKTYRLLVTVKSEVARKMNVVLGNGDPFVDYARFNATDITTEEKTLEFVFTVTHPTLAVKLVFELGSQDGFADGLVTFSEVKLQEAVLDDIITNGNFNDGWSLWFQDWGDMPTVTYDRTGGTFNITTDKSGEANWAIQFNQLPITLEADTTYVFSFDAMATAARDINVKLFVPEVWVNQIEMLNHMLSTEMTTYTYEFTTETDNLEGLTLSFELGLTTSFAAGTVSFDNISLKEKDVEDAPEIIINGDATTVPSFNYDNSGEGAGTMVLGEENEAVIEVTTLGSQSYMPHFYQIVDSLAPGNYVLKIVIDSTVDRDLRVNLVLPNAGWVSILPDNAVDFDVTAAETTTFYVEFTVAAEVTDVKVELDFGTLGGEAVSELGTFTIQEVYIYQNLN
jgi:hypothetical protein